VANPQEIDRDNLKYPDYPVEAKYLEDPINMSVEDLSTVLWLVLTDRMRLDEEQGQTLAFAVSDKLDGTQYTQDDNLKALKTIQDIVIGMDL